MAVTGEIQGPSVNSGDPELIMKNAGLSLATSDRSVHSKPDYSYWLCDSGLVA